MCSNVSEHLFLLYYRHPSCLRVRVRMCSSSALTSGPVTPGAKERIAIVTVGEFDGLSNLFNATSPGGYNYNIASAFLLRRPGTIHRHPGKNKNSISKGLLASKQHIRPRSQNKSSMRPSCRPEQTTYLTHVEHRHYTMIVYY